MATGIKHTTTADGTVINRPAIWSEQHTYDASLSTYPHRFVWKDVDQVVLNLLNQTATVNWTDLDLTAYTSANAKAVYLDLVIGVDTSTKHYELQARKNGTTPTWNPTLFVHSAYATSGQWHELPVIVGMDTGQVIEYYCYVQSGGQADFKIAVLGYWE